MHRPLKQSSQPAASPWRRILFLLSHEQRRMLAMLIILTLISMALEMLGVGLIIPVLNLIAGRDPFEQYPALQPWSGYIGAIDHAYLMIIAVLVLAAIYTFKTAYLCYLTWKQFNFIFKVRSYLSQQLFAAYLDQPYTFYLQRNPSQLIQNVINEINIFAEILQAVLTLLAEGLVFIGIIVLLFYVEPLIILFMTVCLLILLFSYLVTRGIVVGWGESRQHHEKFRMQCIQQSLEGIKEIKLFGRENYFFDKYQYHNTGSASASERYSVLRALPRLWLELLVVFTLVIAVLVLSWKGSPTEMLLPVSGLFVAVAFRFIPLVSRLLSAIQVLRFNLPVINTLYDEIRLVGHCATDQSWGRHAGTPVFFRDSITLSKVCFSYRPDEKTILQDVNLTIKCGQMVGFSGATGAGKTTLINIIIGLLTPDSGVVLVDGQDIRDNYKGWQARIAYVPQSVFLMDSTIRENIAFGLLLAEINEAMILKAVRIARLESFIDNLPQGLDTVVGERGVRLSGGQRQRIGIARAVYHDPDVMVLDEASNALDVDTEKELMQAIYGLRGEKTILVIAHRASPLDVCERVFNIGNGGITEKPQIISSVRLNEPAED